MIEVINKLYNEGTLKQLVGAGLMSPKVLFYREVYLDYDKNLRINVKTKKMDAIQATADTFKVNISVVYRAINAMKQ